MEGGSTSVTCNLCGATLAVDTDSVVASAELTTFVDAHYEHGSISVGLVFHPYGD